ncbi:hypothetical protein COT78_03420 [Candidatus Berkelbacteria bacterium CG10_big_fil_rev_8_21_14_0_10_43_13]|uniref:Uncharacterized protein n=1 Tax=Candidatus Berkelbacteria bacterium CG10_big_fil_rev_8_21_14_0_10_43_13 TaxID=1974514 RepID=A0A2H0W5Y8_9BACT|nr:MAG: hypothetical protein COT78_03420 [Candidatus Berkelbacteria bacterium CG10_big_fil_rev_8_21_14_0_10_43_13]
MQSETKIEKIVKNLTTQMVKGFADQEKRFDNKIENLTAQMVKGFTDQEKRFDNKIENLAVSVANGFADQNERFGKRFDNLEKDNVWIKDTLENHSSTLARLDQERFFTINHVNRLESEIKEIKKFLKLA